MLRIVINGLSLDYDEDYGISKRKGWSVAINGHYVVEFEKWLTIALWRAWKAWRELEEG